jgi:hypothetical protein
LALGAWILCGAQEVRWEYSHPANDLSDMTAETAKHLDQVEAAVKQRNQCSSNTRTWTLYGTSSSSA